MSYYFIISTSLFIIFASIIGVHSLYKFIKCYKQYLKRCSKGKVYCEECTHNRDFGVCDIYIKHVVEEEEENHYCRPKLRIKDCYGKCMEKNSNNDCKDFKPMSFYRFWLEDTSCYRYEYLED